MVLGASFLPTLEQDFQTLHPAVRLETGTSESAIPVSSLRQGRLEQRNAQPA
jgi:DNA-binding transcriptional LysR family regulator